jgi:hypothetical protein
MVRYNPNLVFLFLSENVTAFARTENETMRIELQLSRVERGSQALSSLSLYLYQQINPLYNISFVSTY